MLNHFEIVLTFSAKFIYLIVERQEEKGILGDREVSAGNEANATGESELFRLLAAENIEHFNQQNVTKITALSPHDFNALIYDYPALGGAYQVKEISEIVNERLKAK